MRSEGYSAQSLVTDKRSYGVNDDIMKTKSFTRKFPDGGWRRIRCSHVWSL